MDHGLSGFKNYEGYTLTASKVTDPFSTAELKASKLKSGESMELDIFSWRKTSLNCSALTKETYKSSSYYLISVLSTETIEMKQGKVGDRGIDFTWFYRDKSGFYHQRIEDGGKQHHPSPNSLLIHYRKKVCGGRFSIESLWVDFCLLNPYTHFACHPPIHNKQDLFDKRYSHKNNWLKWKHGKG